MSFRHSFRHARFILLAAALTLLTPLQHNADAAPLPLTAPPAAERAIIAVQSCNAVREFCRARWGRSREWTQCVRARGCRARRARVINYCRDVRQRCAINYVPNRPPFRRCMARNGC